MTDDINSLSNGFPDPVNNSGASESYRNDALRNSGADNDNIAISSDSSSYSQEDYYSFPTSSGKITEITDDSSTKEKRHKPRFPFGYFAVILVICIIVSSLSGAGGAFFMYKMLPVNVTPDHETVSYPYDSEETEDDAPRYEDHISEEIITAGIINEESSSFINSSQEGSGSSATTPDIDATTAPPATTEPATEEYVLTKGDIYAIAVHSIVAITCTWDETFNSIFGTFSRTYQNSGTGFIISNKGHIITNYHVVEKGTTITVTDYSGNVYQATLIGSEPTNDFAVLKIDAVTIPVTLGNSSELKVGDDIMVIGNALGELSYSFTDGIVSHLSRSVTVESGDIINMFQTNAAINNGNSGGPVYNMEGEVVGIASAKYASDKIEGLGFCIPIDDVKGMLADILLENLSAG